MGLVAPLIATALALAAPSTQTSERAVALLSDNRLIELALPAVLDGRTAMRLTTYALEPGGAVSRHRSRR